MAAGGDRPARADRAATWTARRRSARRGRTAGGERRRRAGRGDIAALVARRRRDGLEAVASDRPAGGSGRGRTADVPGPFVDAVERSLVAAGRRTSDILPGGLPPTWLGANFEVHGLPTSARSTLSYALRWHGDRPALLWEQSRSPVTLTATAIDPAWSSDAPSGEAPPRRDRRAIAPRPRSRHPTEPDRDRLMRPARPRRFA